MKTTKKGELSTPIFLRKAFDMINTCDPSLANWSDDGTTFVIKEPELFASQIIPSYFKHANLSSFVRQLNFYGFRKIKSDPLRLREAALSEESRFWKFGHRFFVQGREDLLAQIKKDKDKNETSVDKADVDKLKVENAELKRKVLEMEQDVEELKVSLPVLLQKVESVEKKQRTAQLYTEPAPLHLGEDFFKSMENYGNHLMPDGLSIGSIGEDYLLSLDYETDVPSKRNVQSTTPNSARNAITTALANDLCQALSRLPLTQQTLLVDRLVNAVCNPVELQRQVDMVVASTSTKSTSDVTAECGNSHGAVLDKGVLSNTQDNITHVIASTGGLGYLNSYLSKGTEVQQQSTAVPSVYSISGGVITKSKAFR